MCHRGRIGLSFGGKVLFGTIIVLYLIGGFMLISSTPLYLIYGFGIYEARYMTAKEECPKESVVNQCGMGLGITLTAACLGLALGITLFINGLALIVYCRVSPRHVWPLVISLAAFFVFLSSLVLILFFVASYSKELEDNCRWKVEQLPVQDEETGEILFCGASNSSRANIPVPPPPPAPPNISEAWNCSNTPNFASYRTLRGGAQDSNKDKCLKRWIQFEVITRAVYQTYIGLLAGVFVITCAALFLLLIAYCCGQVTKGQISIVNIPGDVGTSQIEEKFQTAQKTEIDPKTESAQVQFENKKVGLVAFETSDLIKIGHWKLKWIRPNEMYILNILPNVTTQNIQDEFPGAKKVTFETTEFEDEETIATLLFGDEDEAEISYEKSLRRKLGRHQLDGNMLFICLKKDPVELQKSGSDSPESETSLEAIRSANRFSADSKKSVENANTNVPFSPPASKPHQQQQQPTSHKPHPKVAPNPPKPPEKPKPPPKDLADVGNEHLEDNALANKMWGEATTKFSNISHILETDIYVTNLPEGVSKSELIKVFDGAKRVYINHNMAMIGYETRKEAARGYKLAAPKLVKGHKLHITIYRPEGLLRRHSRTRQSEHSSIPRNDRSTSSSTHAQLAQETKPPQDGGHKNKKPSQQHPVKFNQVKPK